ncbi:MAG: methylase, partial [Armatimonadetes bacterium]|nr:methylase [Armatimonadota bacterium]NIO96946.1 methylase [Armatimonadota bacterium]
VMSEGEETLCELLAATLHSGWEPGILSRVAGIAYRDGEQVIVNEPRPVITPLDSLPYPQRSTNPSQPTEATIFTSRGCPYSCVFCAS